MSRLALQVTFDCADPHALARFWADALGMQVEDHDELIGRMLDEGHAASTDVVLIDGRRGWVEAATCADPEGRHPRMLFQLVPEAKSVKNRVHLDLHVDVNIDDDQSAATGDRDVVRLAEVVRLEGLGATRLWDGELGPQRWVTMADPEGNEFCVG